MGGCTNPPKNIKQALGIKKYIGQNSYDGKKYRASLRVATPSQLLCKETCRKEGNRTIMKRDTHTILVYKCQVLKNEILCETVTLEVWKYWKV